MTSSQELGVERRTSLDAEGPERIEHIEFDVSPSMSVRSSDVHHSSGDFGRPTKPPLIASQFIQGKRRSSTTGQVSWPVLIVLRFLRHPVVVNGLGLLTLFDAYLTCADIDRRAAGQDRSDWMSIARDVCLIVYLLEYIGWCWVKRCNVFVDNFLLIDLFILITGFVDLIVERILHQEQMLMEQFVWLRFLRIIRIMRILRLLRRITYLKELRKLLTMATTCMKTLLWSFLFCFVIMSVWAMLLVELVYPLITENPELTDCDQCQRAAGSVMDANLLLFKTVIAGDSWGLIAVPLIEAHPATAIIFVGSLLTLEFGVLNLIVAVVVDTFAEIRERDVINRAEEMEAEIEQDRRLLQKIFDRADEDGSGELTFEELLEGARNDPQFQSRLRVMDIDEADLEQLFRMIDVDGSGAVEREEFVAPLSRWVHESKTATRFIKYNVARALHENDELREYTTHKFEQLNANIHRIAVCLGVPLAESSRAMNKRSSTKSLHSQSGSERREKDPSPTLRRQPTSDAVAPSFRRQQTSDAAGLGSIAKQKSIASRLQAMEEQQKTLFQTLLGSGTGEDSTPRRSPMLDPSQSQSISMTASSPTSSLSVPAFHNAEAGKKPGRPNGPPPSSDGDEAPPPSGGEPASQAEIGPSLRMEDPHEVDTVEACLDFSSFKDFYNRRRLNLEDSADVSHNSSSSDLEGLETEFLKSRSSVREMDSVLRGTMEVVEDLLQSAASAAVTRAEYTLRLRLGALMSEIGGNTRPCSHRSSHAVRGTTKDTAAMSPALLLGSMGPEERRRWQTLEAVMEADVLPAPPPNQRLRSLDDPPDRGKRPPLHVDVVESYPVQI